MSTYEMMKSDLPAYGQQEGAPGAGYQQQQPAGGYQQQQPAGGYQQQGQFVQVAPENTFSAREVQHHNPPPPRRDPDGDDTDKEDDDHDKDIMGPGDIPDKALDLEFDKCFHEHKSTKTFRHLNMCLGVTYKYTKLVIYHIFVILIGVPMAIIWAILNGIMVFILVWLYQPLLRVTVMWIYAVTPLVTVPIQAIFTPLVDVGARIFRQIRIKASLDGSFAESLARRSSRVHSV